MLSQSGMGAITCEERKKVLRQKVEEKPDNGTSYDGNQCGNNGKNGDGISVEMIAKTMMFFNLIFFTFIIHVSPQRRESVI